MIARFFFILVICVIFSGCSLPEPHADSLRFFQCIDHFHVKDC